MLLVDLDLRTIVYDSIDARGLSRPNKSIVLRLPEDTFVPLGEMAKRDLDEQMNGKRGSPRSVRVEPAPISERLSQALERFLRTYVKDLRRETSAPIPCKGIFRPKESFPIRR